jgi:stearoyl-CoA desaturase (delta-9 desaturase)
VECEELERQSPSLFRPKCSIPFVLSQSNHMTTVQIKTISVPQKDPAKFSYVEPNELVLGKDSINFLFFASAHVAAVIGLFFVEHSWGMYWVCIGLYYLRMFGITAGYHRFFSHKSYQTSRAFQFVLAWLGGMSLQKGALWWAAAHRHHHKYADHEEDVHSPTLRGFLWSHTGWFLLSNDNVETKWGYIPDLIKYPELVWLNKHHTVPAASLALALYLWGGIPLFYWGFLLSTVLLWHGTFTINSLAHVFGSRRYVTDDTSKNNFWLSLITLGEGWHNNHHTYKSSAHQGFFWYEIDPTYLILVLLSWIGLVSNLRTAPLDKLEEKLISRVGRDAFMESVNNRLVLSKKKSV